MIVEWAGLWPVYEWDVYNEPYGNHEVQRILGNEVMLKWFKLAQSNSVSPHCGLFINDNRMVSAMSPAQYINRTGVYRTYIDYLLEHNAPITGIGFQNRIKFEYGNPQLLYDRLEDFAVYGLDLAGTEFHIRPSVFQGVVFDPTAFRRAQMTEEIMTTYFSHPQATGLNCWSFHSNDATDGAFLDEDGDVALNALVWYYLNRIRYSTETALTTDNRGTGRMRGFIGQYDVIVHAGSETMQTTLRLDTTSEQKTTLYFHPDARIDRVEAVAASHVSTRAPRSNFGGQSLLTLEAGAQTAYLKFNVNTPPGPIGSARLHLYSETEGDMLEAWSVHYGNWTERAITRANAPQPAHPITTAQASPGSWVCLDLSNHITNNGTYTIALTESGGGTEQYIASRESTFAPWLEVMPSPDTDADGLQDAVDTDDDNDLLPDLYEQHYGLAPRNPHDALLDPDEDGACSLFEYAVGTDPSHPASKAGGREVALTATPDGLQLRFNRRSGLETLGWAVALEYSKNLTDWSRVEAPAFSGTGCWIQPLQTNRVENPFGPLEQLHYTLKPEAASGFFRARLVPCSTSLMRFHYPLSVSWRSLHT